ncbi:MAG: alpha-ketoglutarate-dependent dioxygenase AlkB [Verrucomicrobia bacterium]|nr:MAG: alpha-ketoglutarate-dependent dioxygenase AlkB [Verrucomicrobiota bacterium]
MEFDLKRANLLPKDGTAIYYGPIFRADEALTYHSHLLENIAWKSDETIIFGRRLVTARKVAWYGDQPYVYRYSGGTKTALQWTNELHNLKNIVEAHLKTKFNSCLLNLYHTGREGIGWHSDDETVLGSTPTIASLSLGAERKFSFRHKATKEIVSIFLENGSLLVMSGITQAYWQHSLPKTQRVNSSRISLTFRTII